MLFFNKSSAGGTREDGTPTKYKSLCTVKVVKILHHTL